MSDTTAPTVEEWRGVAAESADDATQQTIAAFLRSRSRRLLASLLRPHKRAAKLATALVIAETLARLAGPYLIQVGIDRGIPPIKEHGDRSTLFVIVAIFLAIVGLRAVLQYSFLAVSGKMGQDILLDLRGRLYEHFQRLSLSFHERYTSGRVISRLTSDVEAIAELLGTGLLSVTVGVLSIVGIGVVLATLDLFLAVITLLVFPLVVLFTRWFQRESEVVYRESREAIALVIVQFVESLGGIRAVQAFRREPRNQAIFEDVNGRLADANIRSNRIGAIFGPGMRALGQGSMAIVLVVGSYRVIGGQMSIGVLAAFIVYVRRFFEPMQDLSQFYNLFQAAAAALEKLSGVLEEKPAVPEPANPVSLLEPRGAVRFEHVRFGYRDTEVLHDVSIDVPAGQTVALVGETGAGKSTIARLIARFYDPTGGRITLDGVDLRELADETLRRAVVMVTQENYLFSGTLGDNIRFGRPDATMAEVEAAARAIGAHEFISALPDGYDTDVRKRGGRLSAGQRQLVAFARAFLADPRVLILDEATSSLDIPSERLVQRALRTLLADRTAVIIAHRLTTVEIADRVLVIDDGRVVEDGSPAKLIGSTGSRYRALHEAWLDSLV